MNKRMVFGFVFVLLLDAFALAGCTPQDIIDESGRKIGKVEVTEGQDGSTRTTVTISPFKKAEEGERCSSNSDCGMKAKCIHGVCVPVECMFVSDCDDSVDICYQGHCLTEAELFERFDQWKMNSKCTGTCKNCKSGEFKSTMASGRDDEDYRICPDCWDDEDCVDGAWCDFGKCVKE